jgi:hypothetical protein
MGQGSNHDLREAGGQVVALDDMSSAAAPIAPRSVRSSFAPMRVPDSPAGPSLMRQTGAVLGITFGYLDGR